MTQELDQVRLLAILCYIECAETLTVVKRGKCRNTVQQQLRYFSVDRDGRLMQRVPAAIVGRFSEDGYTIQQLLHDFGAILVGKPQPTSLEREPLHFQLMKQI